jgi:hypothetical protein
MRFTLIVAMLAAVCASATTYTFTADITKAVDDSTAVKAKAFGIPAVQSVVTEITFDLGFPEESPGMYDIKITSFKQTTYGADRDEGGYRDEEKLEAVWPGKTITLDIFALNDDGFVRDPMLAQDSEYFDYNLLAFMLTPEGETAAGSISRNCIRSTTIVEEATLDGEGNVTVAQALTQDDKTVKMAGSASYTGTLTRTMGGEGLPDSAELTLTGVQKRLITIFGGDNELIDDITIKLYLVEEVSATPDGD